MAKRRSADVAEIDKKPLTRNRLRNSWDVFSFIRPYRLQFVVSMLFLFASTATSLALPALLGQLADASITGSLSRPGFSQIIPLPESGNTLDLINVVAVFLVLVIVLQAVFSFGRVYFSALVSQNSMADIRLALYRKVITLPIFFFEKRRVGELTSRISADVAQLQETLSITLAEFLRQLITLIGGISILFLWSAKLTVFMLATFPIMVVLALVFGRYIRKLARQTQDELANSSVIVEETFHAVNVVKAFTNEWMEIQRYRKALKNVVGFGLKSDTARGLFFSFIILALFGGIILTLWFGARMVSEGEISIGDLLSFIMYTIFIGGSVGGMGNLYGQLQKSVGASERVLEILREESELEAEEEVLDINLRGRVNFDEVQFFYPSRPDLEVLKKVSFEIESGEKVALVGHSGAGKSTIVQLLMRLYEIQDGEIRVDGKPLSQYNLTALRKHIGIVPQEVILFGGSIRENIAYGNPNASDEEITEAARKANALEFIETFPEGLETLVGERGIKLSGGQRQRIAIARAILKDPAILILDEATSSLDNESERLVQEALNELMENRTTIVIAHRLSTIRKVDTIYVLEGGEIQESGKHETLKDIEGGIYHKLLSQSGLM